MRSAGSGPNQLHVLEALGSKRVFPILGTTDCALRLCHSAKLMNSWSPVWGLLAAAIFFSYAEQVTALPGATPYEKYPVVSILLLLWVVAAGAGCIWNACRSKWLNDL